MSPQLIDVKHATNLKANNLFVFPILQSPHDVTLIFRICHLHTAWEFLHGNGGSERPEAWHGQLLHWHTPA